MEKTIYTKFQTEIHTTTEDSVTYKITTNDEDRTGDVMNMLGCDFQHYLSNPVVLWNHDHSIPAVANCVSLEVKADAIFATAKFHGLTEFAEDIKKLALAKVLNTTSIGFIPKTWKDFKNAIGETVREFTSWELLEFSIVNIPMNPFAVGMAYQKAIEENIISKEGAFMAEITKAGRVLSAMNEAKLRQIAALVNEVLDSMQSDNPAQEPIITATADAPQFVETRTITNTELDRLFFGGC